MKKNNFKQRKNVGDYVGTCDTCKQYFWASKGTVMGKYTSKEGAWVCPNCVDKIDYGLVPYQVLPEDSVNLARSLNFENDPQNIPNDPLPSALDISEIDPMSISNPAREL